MPELVLAIRSEDGRAFVTPLKWGGELRVAFGQLGMRASVWKFTARPVGDVYVVERQTGSLLRASLHKSGDWRWQWVPGSMERSDVAKAAISANGGSRIVRRWRRPADSSSGLTPVFAVWTSGEDICSAPDDRTPAEETLWLPAPNRSEAAILHLFLLKPKGETIKLEGFLPLAAFAMKTGEALLIATSRRLVADQERAWLALRRPALLAMPGREKVIAPRALVYLDSDEQGVRWVLDLAG
jgi:hypothetical protein